MKRGGIPNFNILPSWDNSRGRKREGRMKIKLGRQEWRERKAGFQCFQRKDSFGKQEKKDKKKVAEHKRKVKQGIKILLEGRGGKMAGEEGERRGEGTM